MTLEKIAERVINDLTKQGVIIERYNSVKSNSIYLKLDHGVANSVRISDHAGKRNMHRYNLQTNLKVAHIRGQMHYYKRHDVMKMIQQILEDRKQRRKQYGNKYYDYMYNNKRVELHNKLNWWREE